MGETEAINQTSTNQTSTKPGKMQTGTEQPGKMQTGTEQLNAVIKKQSHNGTGKVKCKICKAGAGKLLKILKLHFKGVPNQRVSWNELLENINVEERPLKPIT